MDNENNCNGNWFKNIINHFISKGYIYFLLICGLLLMYKLIPKGLTIFFAYCTLPLALILIATILRYSRQGFYTLFISQFLIVIVTIFIDVKTGIVTLATSLVITLIFIIRSIYEKGSWKESVNGMLWLYSIWGIYCFIEILNPNFVMEAWSVSITHYLIYPIICAVLVPIAIRNTTNIQWILIIWSIFILIGVAKGYWQKNQGFNEREFYFLYTLGGHRTHIIWSGIRYFSCFTDAANFGVHMAMGGTVLGISAIYVKKTWLKLYLIAVTIAAIYGMGISGTRSAVAIPVGALCMYIILSRNWKACIVGGLVLCSSIAFFLFTDIGNDNAYIRKMRSAFAPTEDASYLVRVENRKKMKEYMNSKPFGYGIGLGGKNAERFHAKELLPYPTDSWLISVWTDTGIIGLILYILIHGVLFAWCSWILMFKIMSKRLRGLLTAWLCMNAGFFISTYTNDVMQYPNSIVIYTGFALCFAGPYIDKQIIKKKTEDEKSNVNEDQTAQGQIV